MLQDIAILAISLLLIAHKAMSTRKGRDWLFLAAAVAVGIVVAYYEGAGALSMLEGILIFNGVVSTYHSRKNYAFLALAVFFLVPLYPHVILMSQAMLLGFLSGSYFFLKPNAGRASKLEKRRDVVQIMGGFALILAYVKLPIWQADFGIMLFIVLASAVGNYGVMNKRGSISKTLYAFERKNAMLGQGAMWLAMGVLSAIAFLNAIQAIAVLAAILIGDSVATLVGTAWRIPIPYNRKKSAAGTVAYFVSAAIISFPFLGYAGIIASLAGALVESAPRQIDDNFDTAVALIILIRILAYAGIP